MIISQGCVCLCVLGVSERRFSYFDLFYKLQKTETDYGSVLLLKN